MPTPCQVERDLARYDAQLAKEAAWDRAVERLTENGIDCDKCGETVFPYKGKELESFEYRTRYLLWTENINKAEITWKCPDCGEIARVCV